MSKEEELKKILSLLIIGLISYFVFLTDDKPTLEPIEDLPVRSRSLGEKKPSPTKTVVTERITTSDQTDPVKELEERWQEELKDYLMIIAPNESSEIFNQYLAARRELQGRSAPLEIELEKYSNATSLEDKKRFIALDKSRDIVRSEYKEKIKMIFGNFYQPVQNYYADHLESIQIHHNGEGKLGLDIGFSD